MLIRKLAVALVLTTAASLAGCKCCNWGRECQSPALISATPIAPPAPCNGCGGVPAGPGAVVPPPPAPVPPGAVPPGPYGASYGRKI
jgi:hypothetical protein